MSMSIKKVLIILSILLLSYHIYIFNEDPVLIEELPYSITGLILCSACIIYLLFLIFVRLKKSSGWYKNVINRNKLQQSVFIPKFTIALIMIIGCFIYCYSSFKQHPVNTTQSISNKQDQLEMESKQVVLIKPTQIDKRDRTINYYQPPSRISNQSSAELFGRENEKQPSQFAMAQLRELEHKVSRLENNGESVNEYIYENPLFGSQRIQNEMNSLDHRISHLEEGLDAMSAVQENRLNTYRRDHPDYMNDLGFYNSLKNQNIDELDDQISDLRDEFNDIKNDNSGFPR